MDNNDKMGGKLYSSDYDDLSKDISSFHTSGYLSSSNVSVSSNDTHSDLFARELKVDKKVLRIMQNGGDDENPSFDEFFTPLRNMGVVIDFSSTFRDRQGHEIPILKVSSYNHVSLEYACAKIMQSLDPHRDKMTFNIDVPSSDHSFIIGKDGARIKQLSKDTQCHIHLPDCNKAMGKKSNKISIAGTNFVNIECARDSIRKNLPLNIQFCLEVDSNKISMLDSSSSEIQSIKRRHMVDVNFFGLSSLSTTQHGFINVAVKGNRSQLGPINAAICEIYRLAYGREYHPDALEFEISIDISHIHHQYVRGKNNCNLKVIHQRCGANIIFPQDKSNIVRIQSRNINRVVMGWQEIMGYLPLMLSFDLNLSEERIREFAAVLEKRHSISIRWREKLASTIYTMFIKTQERHSLCLNEIREQFQKNNPDPRHVSSVPSFLQDVVPTSGSPTSYPISDTTINTFKFPVSGTLQRPPSPRITRSRNGLHDQYFGSNSSDSIWNGHTNERTPNMFRFPVSETLAPGPLASSPAPARTQNALHTLQYGFPNRFLAGNGTESIWNRFQNRFLTGNTTDSIWNGSPNERAPNTFRFPKPENISPLSSITF